MQDDEGMEEEGMPMQQPEGEGSFLGMSMSDEMPVESDEETEEMMTMPEEKRELV